MTTTTTKMDELHALVKQRLGFWIPDEDLWRWLRENDGDVEKTVQGIEKASQLWSTDFEGNPLR